MIKKVMICLLKLNLLISAVIISAFLTGCEKQDNSITFESLLKEMTDRESITKFPDYTLKQASSYDRTQTSPENKDTWFNNKDYGNFIRKEVVQGRTEYVIMEENGPGCIVRWWIPFRLTTATVPCASILMKNRSRSLKKITMISSPVSHL
jgi:hypothetical protein